MKKAMAGIAVAIVSLGLSGSPVSAAQQTLAGKRFLIKNPDPGGDVTRRKIVYFAKELNSADTLVGDPTVSGAKLKVKLDGHEQCFNMPNIGWSRRSIGAFKYKDKTGANGPVKSALIKRRDGGIVFINKVTVIATLGPGPQPHITLVPPAAEINTNLKIGGGDEYCAKFGGTISKNDTFALKAKDSPNPGPPCGATACSPSGAFLDATNSPF